MKYLTINELNAVKPKNSKLTAFAFGISIRYNGGSCVRSVICWCECGKVKKTSAKEFKTGGVKSCGCISFLKGNIKHGFASGNANHPLYRVWAGMKDRCYYKKNKRYNRYGLRGIKVCSEWKNDASRFIKWALKNGWEKGLQIDRINNNGNYTPTNCRFVTNAENVNNRELTIFLEYNGVRATVRDWAITIGVSQGAIRHRIRSGNSIERILAPKYFRKP